MSALSLRQYIQLMKTIHSSSQMLISESILISMVPFLLFGQELRQRRSLPLVTKSLSLLIQHHGILTAHTSLRMRQQC